jgi:hypothetical protein
MSHRLFRGPEKKRYGETGVSMKSLIASSSRRIDILKG